MIPGLGGHEGHTYLFSVSTYHMVSRLLFGYQLERLARWRRLSPLGKVWWGIRKAVALVVVATVVSALYLWGTYREVLQPVLDGAASATTLVGPVLASLPVLAVIVLVSVFAVLVPVRDTNDWE